MTQLIKDARLLADDWQKVPADFDESMPLPPGRILVPLACWKQRAEELRVRNEEFGIWLDGHAEPQDFADALGIVRLIAIHFPVFSDGRGYSLARILREQMGYKGELRAIGDVLRDQLFLMRRCGFDSFEMRADRNAADALPGLTDFSFAYQRAVVDPSVPLVMRETLPAR
jgi:uncharacterized protein (DUF934 family)